MGKKKKDIPTPTAPTHDLVRKYVTTYIGNARFMSGDEAIRNLVRLFPANGTFHEVLAKVCVINELYATGIKATYDMAKHIVDLNVDQALALANAEVVDRISTLTVGEKPRHNYSFATKYCAWHHPEHYPMFDDFVRQMLLAYRDKDKFTTFEEDKLRRYLEFKRVMIAFQSHYQLTGFSFRELDHFLWGYGKELFPKQDRKNTKPVTPPYSEPAVRSPHG